MRKIIYLFSVLFLFSIGHIYSQVTIGSSDKPDDSAILDLKQKADGTSDKGLLIPRVKLEETILPDPMKAFVEGLVVYNLESVNDVETGFYYCDGSRWILLRPTDQINIPMEPWLVTGSNVQATSVSEDIYHTGNVVVGRSGDVDVTAELEVYSDSRGFLMPRLSKIQRDAISNPTESLMIWNIDESCYNFYAQGKWKSMCGDVDNTGYVAVVGCEDIKVEGDYKVGTSLDDKNYISVTVQVSGPCNLRLEGQTTNGFYFQRSGKVLTSGTFTYKIPGYGAPRQVGTTKVEIFAYNNSKLVLDDCSKDVTINAGDGAYTSISFEKSDPLVVGQISAGKTITIKVNVSTAGTFSFYTNDLNGVQYSSTNQDLVFGENEVVLYSNGGAPTDSGTIAYTVSGNGGPDLQNANVIVNDVYADATVDCTKTKVVGNFTLNQATTTSNYIEATANFTTKGKWTGTTTESINGLTFEGNGNITKTGVQTVRLYAVGTPIELATKSYTVTINSDASCTADVSILVPPKNILFIGNISSNVNASLMDLSNFGPTGKSKISSIQIINGGNNPDAATLTSLINSNKIDIILAGWNFKPNADAGKVIAEFMTKKKGFYFQAQGQSLQSYLPNILNNAYGISVVFTSNSYPIYGAKLPASVTDPLGMSFMKGVFGDCTEKILRSDDQASWMGITPDSNSSPLAYLISLPSNGSGDINAPRYLLNYTDNFLLISDWGMLNYTNGEFGSNSPIGFNTTSRSYNSLFDGTSVVTNTTVGVGEVANWVLFGNIMDYIFKYTEQNTQKTYIIQGQ